MATSPLMPLWKYPVRATLDVVVIVLGLLLATWPLIALVLVLKIIF
jgi:hypothetical protein